MRSYDKYDDISENAKCNEFFSFFEGKRDFQMFHKHIKLGFLFSCDLGTFSKCSKYYSLGLFAVLLSEVVYLGWVIH